MTLHPTRNTFHVALAGAALLALGAAARLPEIVAFGGAMLVAVAAGRALALVLVTRLRTAGFEMVWAERARVVRAVHHGEVVLRAELRNRGADAVRAVSVRAVASSMLEVSTEPAVVDLPPGSRVQVDVHVRAPRVGRWGVHGMALEVRGGFLRGDGLFDVPLLFANPFGIEVLPEPLHSLLQTPRGGRSRRMSAVGRTAPRAGEGDELRELRAHVPGDPFKRIAWKASARRGQLLVREMDRDERDIVWLVLDASVELWAGPLGSAPLDHGLDELAALAALHLGHGDEVGLAVTGARLRSWITPDQGAPHAAKIAAALTSAASMVDRDRSELDESEIAQRVAEHARPLDPRGLGDIPRGNLDMLAARAEALRKRAPFAPRMPFARTPREQLLRLYLASFGIESPPRIDGERERAEASLGALFERIATERHRPSVVHVWAPAPSSRAVVFAGIAKLRARRIVVRWTLPNFEASIPVLGPEAKPFQRSVEEAVLLRARSAKKRGVGLLRRWGVHVRDLAPRSVRPPVTQDDGAPLQHGAA